MDHRIDWSGLARLRGTCENGTIVMSGAVVASFWASGSGAGFCGSEVEPLDDTTLG